MKNEIFFTDEFRKSMWDKYGDLQIKIQSLKGIVQNSMPITSENMDEFENEVGDFIEKTHQLRREIVSEFYKRSNG